MVLWANGGRAFLEREYKDEPKAASELFSDLKNWTLGPLERELTEHERERHALPPGSWSDRQITDDTWEVEAAQPLLWALGIINELPPFDRQASWEDYVEAFYDFPDPASWRPELGLASAEAIEEQAKAIESIYWRIRAVRHGPESLDYARKLMQRANSLGHVRLAADGDLALPDGSSIVEIDERRLGELGSINSERLQGLNWLCGQEEDWDMVTSDTIVGWLWDENWSGESPQTPVVTRFKMKFDHWLSRFGKGGGMQG